MIEETKRNRKKKLCKILHKCGGKEGVAETGELVERHHVTAVITTGPGSG